MRDLQIRGAGNILGSEQHGHMECVGYELYMRILEEAILEEKGETVKKEPECTVDVSIDAFIPEKYIPGSSHRLEAYKKISLIRNAEDRTDVTDELLDRYGPMPQSVANLLNVSLLRATGSKAGLSKIEYKDRIITFRPEKIDIKAWSILAARKNGKLLVSLGAQPYISCRVKNPEFAIDSAQKLLNEYIEIEKEISQNERNSI